MKKCTCMGAESFVCRCLWEATLKELADWGYRAEKAEKELEDLKAKPDCTGCIRAKGGEPADVYHGTCFYCCRPDWSNTDHYEAKRKG